MLVVLIELVIDAKIVLSLMPICNLKMTSRMIPKSNVAKPVAIEILRYFVVSISFSINWDKIKNNPKRPKKIMSFPLDDPIRNRYVIGLMIGLNMSVKNIIPANIMQINPIMIVLLSFINNSLIVNTLNK